jgi:hypothetical protein
MLGNVNSTVFEDRLSSTCDCEKVGTGLFLCSGLQHINLLHVTVWMEKVGSFEAELIMLCLISPVSLLLVAYTLTSSVVNYLQFM